MRDTPCPGRSRLPRRGASLVELLAAMTAASVVMATAVDLVHRSFRLESRSRQSIADERTALRLARQFRGDVHAAGIARCAAAADDAWLVVLEGPAATITYSASATGLQRRARPHSGPPTREEFAFAGRPSWTARRDGPLVSLSGTCVAAGSRRAPIVVDVVAALDERAAPAAGDTP